MPIWIGILFVFLPLAGYYAAPILLAWLHPNVPGWAVALGVSIFTFGIFLHYVSDAQKYFTLQLRPGLIDNGLFTTAKTATAFSRGHLSSGIARPPMAARLRSLAGQRRPRGGPRRPA